MKITSAQIREEWKQLGAKHEHILLTDTAFVEPDDLEELKQVMAADKEAFDADFPAKEIPFSEILETPQKKDCDDRAISCHAAVLKHYRKKPELSLSVMHGMCIALKLEGVTLNPTHTLCWTRKGRLYLAEPKALWVRPIDDGDEIWYVTTL